jgi:hypothetical protein
MSTWCENSFVRKKPKASTITPCEAGFVEFGNLVQAARNDAGEGLAAQMDAMALSYARFADEHRAQFELKFRSAPRPARRVWGRPESQNSRRDESPRAANGWGSTGRSELFWRKSFGLWFTGEHAAHGRRRSRWFFMWRCKASAATPYVRPIPASEVSRLSGRGQFRRELGSCRPCSAGLGASPSRPGWSDLSFRLAGETHALPIL